LASPGDVGNESIGRQATTLCHWCLTGGYRGPNRVFDGKVKSWWGEGYAGVCQKPYQFSCWNKTDPNYKFLIGVRQIPFRELAQCRIAADQVIDGKVADPAGGATHYYATSI
jgi:hypothetical protein